MIRVAQLDDAKAIHRIYSPAVRETAVSFELEPPSVEEIRNRITKVLEQYPWLVFERDGNVLGYAYASAYRTRLAYQWSVEVSVYVDAAARRMGIARELYTRLLSMLGQQGYYNAYAAITLPNPSSVALHEALGFTRIGIFTKNGFKLGEWRDVGWWQLAIRRHDDSPTHPIPFPNVDPQVDNAH